MKILLVVIMTLVFVVGCCEMPRYLNQEGKVVKEKIIKKERFRKMGDGGVTDTAFGEQIGYEEALGRMMGEKPTVSVPGESVQPGVSPSAVGIGEVPPEIIPGRRGDEVSPRAWEEETKKEETPAEKAAKKRARRRSILTTEEGGLLSSGPVYRRSILGG